MKEGIKRNTGTSSIFCKDCQELNTTGRFCYAYNCVIRGFNDRGRYLPVKCKDCYNVQHNPCTTVHTIKER